MGMAPGRENGTNGEPMETLRRRCRAGLLAAAGLLAVATLTGCGTGAFASTPAVCRGVEAGSVDPHALEGATFRLGATDDDQSRVLRDLTAQMLCAAGADVVTPPVAPHSLALRQDLENATVDLYWAGLADTWTTDLGRDRTIHDPSALYDAVRHTDAEAHNIIWGPLPAFDSTPTFVVRSETARAENISSDSDLASYLRTHPDATVCMTTEFAALVNGWPGFSDAYHVPPTTATRTMPQEEVAAKTHEGDCDVGVLPRTDTRARALDLTELTDDQSFFLPGNEAPVVRAYTHRTHPELLPLLAPLAQELTTEALSELDRRVSVGGEDPRRVARAFLTEHGFLR